MSLAERSLYDKSYKFQKVNATGPILKKMKDEERFAIKSKAMGIFVRVRILSLSHLVKYR